MKRTPTTASEASETIAVKPAGVTARPPATADGCDKTLARGLELVPELYRVRDAAAVLAVCERTVQSLIAAGHLLSVRLPGSGKKRTPVRIARVDLLAFVARLREASA